MNSRNVVTRHYQNDRFRSCPVCQHVIDVDHDDAIEVHKYMLGFDLVEVVEPLDRDLVSEADPNGLQPTPTPQPKDAFKRAERLAIRLAADETLPPTP